MPVSVLTIDTNLSPQCSDCAQLTRTIEPARTGVHDAVNRPSPDAHPPVRDLILRVSHVDPLCCPVCQNPMRVIAVIDALRVMEKILRYLGVWHDPPPRPPPHGLPGLSRVGREGDFGGRTGNRK